MFSIKFDNPPLWDEVSSSKRRLFLYWENYDKFVLNSFYPPADGYLTFLSFKTLGVSLFAARLVPVMFGVRDLGIRVNLSHVRWQGCPAFIVLLGIALFWLSSLSL